MPTYEYKCECGHRFEVTQPITDEPLTHCTDDECPRYDHVRPSKPGIVRRIIARTAFTLKGTGFHSTDYPARTE